ncbi:glycosyltransferase family 39 protein [Acidovorax sp. CF316]|uniref:glycosyltransferase family 39 protein n=1 Tax=Acidovorax sp. CF316 TaxID=1144317 RepID=UPI001EE63D02|nr:glycosyltransferase family 39 protein [Acidovorax sp. CF316]
MRTSQNSPPSWRGHLLALALLCLLALALHGSALQGGWRWDDGQNLLYSTQYSPGSVFLDPQVTRFVSSSQIAPWNVFLYQVNSALFGFNPWPYYLHHLISLSCAAWALYLLLCHWLGRWQALLPAALLLLGAPAFQMAQQLMVGHYLDGLAFACLALWAQVHAMRSLQWRWSLLAAGMYLLSCLSKEIYVPWIALLLFVPPPAGSPSALARWRYAVPALLVAVAYAAFRIHVFQGVGGYTRVALDGWQAVGGVLGAIARTLSEGLLGAGTLGLVATGLCLACLGAGLAAQPANRRMPLALGAGVAVVVAVFPLLFVVGPGFEWMGNARILWVPWVAACVLWALPWPRRLAGWHKVALLVFVAAAGQQAWVQRQHDRPIAAMFEAYYGFALAPPPGQMLLQPQAQANGMILQAMSVFQARQAIEPQAAHTPPALAWHYPATAQERSRMVTWDDGCSCMVRLGDMPPAQQEAALAARMRSDLFVLPMKRPLHSLAHAFGGAVDNVSVLGNQLNVEGWTPTLGPGRKLAFVGFEQMPQASSMETVQRPDVAQTFGRQDMQGSGFRATLTFATEQAAQASAKEFCAITFSQLPGQEHQIMMLKLPDSQRCDSALTPRPTRVQHTPGVPAQDPVPPKKGP